MLPVLGALILQAAYGAVDLLVVGRFGSTSGLSAVSTGSQVLNLVTFVVTQLAMGVTVLIARYLGERCPEQIGAVIGGAAVVFALVSALLFAVPVGLARPIAVVMQAPTEAVTLTASYVRICGGGTFFIVAYNLLSAIFRGLGDSRSPLLFVLVACLVNVAGDLLLVARLGMDAAVVRSGFAYPEGFRAGDDHDRGALQHGRLLQRQRPAVWVMVQGLVQTLLARLPLAYCMSIQPNASLTKIGLAALVSTAVGILLNVAFYIYLDRRTKKDALLPIPEK